MQALRITQDVSQDGYLHIAVPPGMSRRCEVIILPIEEPGSVPSKGYDTARMQEQTGFARQVLGAQSEDVWNDL